MQSRHIRALIYRNECLLAKLPDENNIEKSNGFMTFIEGYQIFLGFSYEQNITMLVNDRHSKKHFRELLLHPKYGRWVYIVKHLQTEYILLRPDSCDYEGFSADVFSKEKGNEIELINKELVLSLISVMDTEWDKKVLRVFLGLDRSKREVHALGIDSDSIFRDRNMVFGFINSVRNVEKEAEQVLFETLNRKIERIKNDIKKYKTKLSEKSNLWKEYQLEDLKEKIADLSEKLADVELLRIKDKSKIDSLKLRIKRIKNNITHETRLKLRKRGSGRKVLMDENDETFLAEAIENKATAHGRRKDSVLYLNHRVKKKGLLKLVNYNREKRSLALLKSVTAVYNRSRSKNIPSTEARNHIGLSLFCCKKPSKSEDSNNLLTNI